MKQWKKKATQFFEEYVTANADGYDAHGFMSIPCMKASIEILIDKGVFISKEEIARQAMRDYAIFLPTLLFEEGEA